VTYADLERARAVLLVGFEPEDESPIVFLRLRKTMRANGTRIISVSSHVTRGLAKLRAEVRRTVPGGEAAALSTLADDAGLALGADSVILVGERAAAVPGALSAALDLAAGTGAKLGWVPRRAGERGAVETGCLPNLLPGGRPVAEASARADLAAAWGVGSLPARPGLDAAGIVAAAVRGDLGALVVGGVDPADLPDPRAALAALDATGFVVSLEQRTTAVTERADVVLPVAAVAERSGTFVDWEGRVRQFGTTLPEVGTLPDLRALAGIAEEMGSGLGFRTVAAAWAEMVELGAWDGARAPRPEVPAGSAVRPDPGEAVLDTWRLLLDDGTMQAGEPYLAATARRVSARVSRATLDRLGLAEGDEVVLRTASGAVAMPAAAADMPDGVVWAPANSRSLPLRSLLGAGSGDVVRLEKAGAA